MIKPDSLFDGVQTEPKALKPFESLGRSESPRNGKPQMADCLNFSRITKKRQVEDRKRNRTTFTVYQTDTMEMEFHRNHYPKESTIQNLILMTGINAEKIRVWFKNRRAKVQKGRHCQRKGRRANID